MTDGATKSLRAIGPDIWLCDGPVVWVFGFAYPTRMAVIRLTDGPLLIWSPVALTEELKQAVDDLGVVGHIVAPNHLHHLALGDWHAAYRDAKMHAAPRLTRKRPDLAFDAELGDIADPAWSDDLDQVVVRGHAVTDEVVFFHRPSGTVLFTDLLQQFPDNWFSGWRRIIARLDLMTAAEPTVPRKFRIAFRDKDLARVAIGQVLDWPAQQVVMAHGTPVTADASAFLKRAFAFLNADKA